MHWQVIILLEYIYDIFNAQPASIALAFLTYGKIFATIYTTNKETFVKIDQEKRKVEKALKKVRKKSGTFQYINKKAQIMWLGLFIAKN